MSKKLQGNGIWESSRMMLPQHKERINEHRTALQKIVKPTLHTDEIEIINQNISLSLSNRELIKVKIFGEYEYRDIIGVVKSVSGISNKFKIEIEDGYEFVDFNEVLSVELIEYGIDLM
ncbi:YolD-like family protein [Paenibacillus sp. FSL E2-0178]|uniref:YolD-like family protein n=1 Tax=Paenibacillus sp. FSL E2-0178 TaxID=2921361 RepID=UPI0031594390